MSYPPWVDAVEKVLVDIGDAGRVAIRARSTQNRLRRQSGSAVAGSVATADRSAVRRRPFRYPDHVRPRVPPRPGRIFLGWDIDAAYRHQLGPSGITLEQLRAAAGDRSKWNTAGILHAVTQGRALFPDIFGAWL